MINQWANVVRWEMRTRLFLRTTEFLWQEGHTAHATAEEAEEETRKMIEVYRKLAEEHLAIPVYVGRKTEAEKFAGAVQTYCIEAMMGDKKALQAGTSHYLGQNFAKAFDVKFLNKNNEQEYVYATSWGVSTRLVGGLIMAHGDDKGLILPPKVAPYQVVIIPIAKKEEDRIAVMEKVNSIAKELIAKDIRIKIDDNPQQSPGWKFNQYEMQGVPVRMEIGPKDLEKQEVVIVRRDTGLKEFVPMEQITQTITELMPQMQKDLFQKALDFREANTKFVDNYEDFKKAIAAGNFVKAFWAGTGEMEEQIQKETKATVRCIPFEQNEGKGKCFYSGEEASEIAIFGKSY